MVGEPWLEFLFSLDKCRYDVDVMDAVSRLIRLQDGAWSYSDPNEADDAIYKQVLAGTMTASEAAGLLEIHSNTFTKRFKQFKVRLRREQRER